MKPEHERVQNLLKDTVTTMCRNSLRYIRGIKVQGLLGVTLDDEDIFLIHFNEIFQGYGAQEVSIQQADSVSRGEELSPRPETDDSENSAQNEVYFPETVETPPSVERKSSRRKTQPWRAVGGLSDPVGDVSAKKSRLDFHSTTAYALKQHPHSMVVDDDNNNEEIDGYSLVEDCDTGDVDIMKQSYMCAANDDNRDEDLDTSQASNAEDTQDSETVTPNSSSQANVSGENSNLQFVQGGPFIAGIVQNYAETPAEEVSDDPVDQAFPYTPGDQVSGLVSSGLMHVVGTGAESLNWEQQYQQSLTEGQSIDGVKVKQEVDAPQPVDLTSATPQTQASPSRGRRPARSPGMTLPVLTARKSNANGRIRFNQGAKGDYQCNSCGKTYWSRNTLVRHQKVHDPELYPCKKCTLFFPSEEKLVQHDRLKHQGPAWGRYMCSKCHKKFRSNSNLINHINTFHSRPSS